MNAVATVSASGGDWSVITQAVNAWRGRLIYAFAAAEMAVSETLLTLAAVDGRGAPIPLRHLLGQRLADLYAVLSPGGPFAAEGESAALALASFRELEQLRPLICHGQTTVWMRRNGQWAINLDLLAFRSGKAERSARFLHQREAETLLKDVCRRGSRVESTLSALRGVLNVQAPGHGKLPG